MKLGENWVSMSGRSQGGGSEAQNSFRLMVPKIRSPHLKPGILEVEPIALSYPGWPSGSKRMLLGLLGP